ncbi:MAG TPA: hypothetical protein VIF02_02485 [Methylocella sp.]|jgi:hypothetical protein
MTLSIQPMQLSSLPDLHEAPPLDASDLDCLEEIRDVLARHSKLARFAVHLAHRHFDLAPDEILIERPDPDGRTQHVTVAVCPTSRWRGQPPGNSMKAPKCASRTRSTASACRTRT